MRSKRKPCECRAFVSKRTEDLPELLVREPVRLFSVRHVRDPDETSPRQPKGDLVARPLPCRVAIERQDDSLEVQREEIFLLRGHRASHERDDVRKARLVDTHRVEESPDDDGEPHLAGCPAESEHPVEIPELE